MSGSSVKTVSELTKDIADLLEGRFRFVRVAGEISGLRRPLSGHYYFTLKDPHAQIKAVLFKNQQAYLDRVPRDGQQIICDGRVSVYGPRGEYQIIVDTIDFHGTGLLHVAFEQLKERLRAKGYFDPARKRSIPGLVQHIVVITSPGGAAIHDFLTICRKRSGTVHVQLLPVPVQGDGAAREIAVAIKRAHEVRPDVIVLCRGGGSIEDLWAFNEELVAEAIYRATIPIVTGIGHETDSTIADFCADLRGATPTAAAELLIADSAQLRERISAFQARLQRTLNWQFAALQSRLERVNRFLSTFDTVFSRPTLRLDTASSRLENLLHLRLERSLHTYEALQARLRAASPFYRVSRQQGQLAQLCTSLKHAMQRQLATNSHRLQQAAAVLDSLSPLATLGRGYAIVTSTPTDGSTARVITDARQVEKEQEVGVQLRQGRLTCLVTAVHDEAYPPAPGAPRSSVDG